MSSYIRWLAPVALVMAAAPGYGVQYLTLEQAQKSCFGPDAKFEGADIRLSKEQAKTIEARSGVRVRLNDQRVWKVVADGKLEGWFILDEVLGKHEFITYALALSADGAVKRIEVIEYRETYGHEIRNEPWRAQFTGKKYGAKLKLDEDIKNISGATLSCRHITDGVKRLLATYDLVLK